MLGRAVSGSAVDGLHATRRVALTGGDPGRGDLVDGGEVFITERDVHCGDVLLQVGVPVRMLSPAACRGSTRTLTVREGWLRAR